MIEELRIRDLGVIADTTLPLGPGFTAITGETGAGKTMVVTALGLLMGARADATSVRAGAAQARVGGIVQTADEAVAALVDELGGEIEDGELVLGRTVNAEGRSRAAVGGAPSPVGSLGRLSERLFAVHGQSDQLRLKSTSAQRDSLDRFGGAELAKALAEYQRVHRELGAARSRLAELAEARDERAAEAGRLRAELDEIAAVDPVPGEETELSQRIELLANVEALREATASAHEALASDSDDPMVRDAGSLIDGALREVERVAGIDARLDAVAEALHGASLQVVEAGRELASFAADLDAEGPGELERANERYAALTALFRAYGDDSQAVIDYSSRAAARLTELDSDDTVIDELGAAVSRMGAEEDAAALRLTELRRSAALRLSDLVTGELGALALPDARFVAQVSEAAARGASGADDVQFLLAPHPGAEPRPVAKTASGGELSRVMLALEVIIAGADPVPTFVFDEVDSGVGGAAAIEIGRRLARLAENAQVIVVTHLAQVAAFAANHVRVVKDSTGGYTESSCVRLDGDARLAEMARLLSGLSDSESALSHAAELLELGRGG